MRTETREPLTQEESDKRAVFEHAFKNAALDPEVAKRVRERASAVRATLPLTDIAVDLIREMKYCSMRRLATRLPMRTSTWKMHRTNNR